MDGEEEEVVVKVVVKVEDCFVSKSIGNPKPATHGHGFTVEGTMNDYELVIPRFVSTEFTFRLQFARQLAPNCLGSSIYDGFSLRHRNDLIQASLPHRQLSTLFAIIPPIRSITRTSHSIIRRYHH